MTGTAAWLTDGRTAGLFIGATAIVGAGYGGGVFFEAAPVDVTGGTSPVVALRRDRATFRASFIGLGLPLAIGAALAMTVATNPVTGQRNGLVIGISTGVVNLIVAGLGFAFIQTSWGQYSVSRWWLAAKGDLPWRLTSFLADAHAKRGVLRQVGAVYQFRHLELQKRLADQRQAHRSSFLEASKLALLFAGPRSAAGDGLKSPNT